MLPYSKKQSSNSMEYGELRAAASTRHIWMP